MTTNVNKFWTSFKTWYHEEFPVNGMLKNNYIGYDNFNHGTYYVDINYDNIYRQHYGVSWIDIFSKEMIEQPFIDDFFRVFKNFIEMIYEFCIEKEKRYSFTIDINNRLRKFQIPYTLQSGKFVKIGYKTTEKVDKIINYKMCEQKIKSSEEMILSKDIISKKIALKSMVDVLQYLVSIAHGEGYKNKYKSTTLSISVTTNNKIYSVISAELNEIMKISNEYFDIRHHEYLNKAKEKREVLNDSSFVEYLYNRVFALIFIIRLKFNEEVTNDRI